MIYINFIPVLYILQSQLAGFAIANERLRFPESFAICCSMGAVILFLDRAPQLNARRSTFRFTTFRLLAGDIAIRRSGLGRVVQNPPSNRPELMSCLWSLSADKQQSGDMYLVTCPLVYAKLVRFDGGSGLFSCIDIVFSVF